MASRVPIVASRDARAAAKISKTRMGPNGSDYQAEDHHLRRIRESHEERARDGQESLSTKAANCFSRPRKSTPFQHSWKASSPEVPSRIFFT